MPITDRSGIPSVGLALLRANLAKLKGGKATWETKGERRFLVIVGPSGETYESCSFAEGSEPAKTALALIAG